MSNATDADATIDSRDDIPDRDELVELRRDRGLTNGDIAENHITEFSARQIGIFASMYGIEKGWKDAEYLQEQIDRGVTPEDLAEQWPINADTVRGWMSEHGIEENPIPDAYADAVEALEHLAEVVDDDDLATEYEEFANELADDEGRLFA